MITLGQRNKPHIWRARWIADIVHPVLSIAEETLTWLEAAKQPGDFLAKVRTVDNAFKATSLVLGLSQLWELGGNLQIALDGPSYGSRIEAILREAQQGPDAEYEKTIRLYLYGIDGRKSPDAGSAR